MSKRITSLLSLVVLLGSMDASTARPDDNKTAYMTVTSRTSQPIGHYEFCLEHQSECTVRSVSPKPVRLTPPLWNELAAINDAVNLAVAPKTDMELYGVEEYWAYPTTAGDCEDYVLLKRRDLIEKGWPASALLITVVRQRNGDGHAVLTVRTDRGDLVLDNLEGRIMVWADTDYQYVKRQSEYDSGQWMAITDGRSSAVAGISKAAHLDSVR